jgi:hypothetical protein
MWTTVVLILTILGLVIPLTAVAVAFVRVRRQFRASSAKLAQAQQLRLEADHVRGADQEALIARADSILKPSSTFADVLFLREVMENYILEAEWSELKWPAVVGVFGLVVATAASVWSLYL